MGLSLLSEKRKQAVSALKELWQNKKLMKKCAVHFGTGAAAVAVALVSIQPGVMGITSSKDEQVVENNVQTTTSVTTTAPMQTVYVTETWWKAGIDEYDLIEYTNTDIELSPQKDSEQDKKDPVKEEPFPNGSFTVAKPSASTNVKSPSIQAHKSYGTRNIANEYYTVKSLTTGGRVSGNGYDMVCMILNGEMGPAFSDEALKAQAVAIYTYLRYCDANGLVPVVATRKGYGTKIKNAVNAVQGQMLTYNGEIVNAVFCASTAGNTASSASVWGGSLPYLTGVTSEFDKYDPNYGVKRSFTAKELKRIIEAKTNIELSNSDVENWFEIVNCTNGRYVGDIKIGGNTHARVGGRNVRLTGAVLRGSILGNNTLRSTAFDITYKDGVFTFTTYGYGHGVGMSQWGAQLMSTKGGYKYDQILLHYYNGAKLSCSGINNEAVDRFGKDEDISEKEEATPGDKPQEEPVQTSKPQETVTVTQTTTLAQTTTPTVLETTASQSTQSEAPATTTVVQTEPEIVETTVTSVTEPQVTTTTTFSE